MKNEKEELDFLLEKNMSEHLSNVDWEQLNNAISQRLNQTDKNSVPEKQYRVLFKFAACIGVVAAVVVFATFLDSDKKQMNKRLAAIVTFTEVRGSAKVEILDSNEKENQNTKQSMCIIIRKQESENANSGINKDDLDFGCLL